MELTLNRGKKTLPFVQDAGIPVWFRHRGIPTQMENRASGTTAGIMNHDLSLDSNSHVACPKNFKNRVQVSKAIYKTENPFSLHDNRNRLQGDGVYFGQGLGRHKVKNNVNVRNVEDIISWNDEKESRLRVTNSLYREDFLRPKTNASEVSTLVQNRRYAKHLPEAKEGLIPPSSSTTLWNPVNKMSEKSYFQILADSQPLIKRHPWINSYNSHSFSELPKLERRRIRSQRKLPSF